MVQSINDSLYLEDYQKHEQSKRNNDLDKDAFLKILMTQLQNQDPMNPMEDKEFIAQMAQFTSVEQVTNINSKLDQFLESQSNPPFSSHGEMIGKQVEWDSEKKLEDGSTVIEQMTGLVTAVSFKDGKTSFVIDGEHTLKPEELNRIALPNLTE
ncbi:flagellar hook assembly protein FlgD [Alteribacter populi]|uniref:flagellar hook assembly protein FlgD n=1 Tax=Alteribacter populi TaxID=2011011 RepID=UPI000BBABA74|nr:flagellar hook assembly protein FlgD [Alteribacter populi]